MVDPLRKLVHPRPVPHPRNGIGQPVAPNRATHPQPPTTTHERGNPHPSPHLRAAEPGINPPAHTAPAADYSPVPTVRARTSRAATPPISPTLPSAPGRSGRSTGAGCRAARRSQARAHSRSATVRPGRSMDVSRPADRGPIERPARPAGSRTHSPGGRPVPRTDDDPADEPGRSEPGIDHTLVRAVSLLACTTCEWGRIT